MYHEFDDKLKNLPLLFAPGADWLEEIKRPNHLNLSGEQNE